MAKWCPFLSFSCFLFVFLGKSFLLLYVGRTGFARTAKSSVLVSKWTYKDTFVHSLRVQLTEDFAVQTLCFACTGGNAILKVSMYFSP
jgi:hypothetical protein